jgi:hypothetical protein
MHLLGLRKPLTLQFVGSESVKVVPQGNVDIQ